LKYINKNILNIQNFQLWTTLIFSCDRILKVLQLYSILYFICNNQNNQYQIKVRTDNYDEW